MSSGKVPKLLNMILSFRKTRLLRNQMTDLYKIYQNFEHQINKTYSTLSQVETAVSRQNYNRKSQEIYKLQRKSTKITKGLNARDETDLCMSISLI
jgi:IS1 family transposase